MDRATILALNQINRNFYTQRAEEFSATRRRPWRGWLQLLPYIGERETLSVLDVGTDRWKELAEEIAAVRLRPMNYRTRAGR